MKRIIFIFVAVFLFGASVSAQTYIISRDLTIGSAGPDVIELQTWLIARGFDIPAVSSGIIPKGYFGIQTQTALAAYQRSVGLPAYGYLGAQTRARMYGPGDSATGSTPIRIVYPNGGEVFPKSSIQTITWTGSIATLNQSGSIWLQYYVPPCAEETNAVRCLIAVQSPVLVAQNVDLGARSYSWVVGNVAQSGLSSVPEGSYKIRVCSAANVCDASDSYFSIARAQGTHGPVITSLVGPATLGVQELGTWSVAVNSDATVDYAISWGDGTTGGSGGSVNASSYKNMSFTHAYSSAGTYTATFTLSNGSGISAVQSTTVRVSGSSNGGSGGAGPLAVTSPNGGESWLRGSTQIVRWTSPYYFRATYADIKAIQYRPCQPGMYCIASLPASYTIARSISINQNSYSWRVGDAFWDDITRSSLQNIPDGQYTIQICETGTSSCDESNAPFTIFTSGNGGAGNQAPVINGIDAPIALGVNQQGTWTVRASDPENGVLSYSVDWGDYQSCPTGYSCAANAITSAIQQNSTFSHSYYYAGTYTVTFTVRDAFGLTAQSRVTVAVGGPVSNQSLKLLSPNGGEYWPAYSTHAITWSRVDADPYSRLDIYLGQLIQPPCVAGSVCQPQFQSQYVLDRNILANTLYNWIVATDIYNNPIPQGAYVVRICTAGSVSSCDTSDATFSIIAPTSSYYPPVYQPTQCPAGYTCTPNR